MADVRVEIDKAGIDQLIEGPEVEQYLITLANKAERDAKRYCPVDTGRLRASIVHDYGVDGEGPYAIIGTDVEYAAHVEYGSRGRQAQPYLRPALEGL